MGTIYKHEIDEYIDNMYEFRPNDLIKMIYTKHEELKKEAQEEVDFLGSIFGLSSETFKRALERHRIIHEIKPPTIYDDGDTNDNNGSNDSSSNRNTD